MKKKKSGDITIRRRSVRLSTMHRLAFKEWLASKGYSGSYTVATAFAKDTDENAMVNAACADIMTDEQFLGKMMNDFDGAVIFHLRGNRTADGKFPRGTFTVLFKDGYPILHSQHYSLYVGVSVWLTHFKYVSETPRAQFFAQVTAAYPWGFACFRRANVADIEAEGEVG